jgi:hypothetical protein
MEDSLSQDNSEIMGHCGFDARRHDDFVRLHKEAGFTRIIDMAREASVLESCDFSSDDLRDIFENRFENNLDSPNYNVIANFCSFTALVAKSYPIAWREYDEEYY